jgi:hypothetical protein
MHKQYKGGTKHTHLRGRTRAKTTLIQQKHKLALHKNKDFLNNKQPLVTAVVNQGRKKAAAYQHSSHPETDPDKNQNRRQKLPHQSQHCYMSRNKFGSAHHFVQEAWGEI